MNFSFKIHIFPHKNCTIVNILLIFLAFLLGSSAGLQLDSDGGYHLTVGLETEISDSETARIYIENLQSNLLGLSTRIFATSSEKFYLKSVTIVTTSAIDVDGTALSENFHESDIKISNAYLIPDVTRSTQCELPGDDIRLPTDFFNDETNDLYKVKDKALLHLWAQYRWGVYEESGYPGNSRFPYFTKDAGGSEWEANACSDTKLEGSYVQPDESQCTVTDVQSPPMECRFEPDLSSNTARSSVMNSFYWIPSLDSFCTAATHNPLLPNRQNLFCGGRSVTEVMESCPDWKKVSGPVEFADPIFTIVRPSTKPLIYILLDNRISSIPESEMSKVRTELKKIFDPSTGLDDDILAALGQFPNPNPNPGPGTEYYEEMYPWTVLSDRIDEFKESIDSTISNGQNPDGLFGRVIKEISESIKSRRHDAGAIIFVFKSVSSPNFELMPFEADVIGSLRTQKIKLFALEISTSSINGGENLQNVATLTGGSHLLITSPSDIESKLGDFIKEFIQVSKSPVLITASPIVIFKDLISSEVPTSVKLLVGNTGQVTLILTSTSNSDLLNVKFTSSAGDITSTTRNEWNEANGKGRRFTYTGVLEKPTTDEVLTVSYSCPSDATGCKAFLLIITDNSPTNSIDVSLLTGNMEYDFDGLAENHVPIFAQLEQNGQPVIGLQGNANLEASATLCLQESLTECWTIPLTDNGAGVPDLLSNDGILSGFFVPSVDGRYKCYATVSYEHANKGVVFAGRNEIIDIDKSVHPNLYPCSLASKTGGCVGVAPKSSFQIVSELPGVITVINVPENTAPSVPTRIMDLEVIYAEQYEVTLSWTSPSVFLRGGIDKVETYDIRFCLDPIIDYENCESIAFIGELAEPGERELLQVTMESESTHYFVIKSVYMGETSPLSNIASQTPNENPVTTPLPSTDPTTEEPTEPTTETELPTDTTTEQPTDRTTTTESLTDPTDSSAETSTGPTTKPSTEITTEFSINSTTEFSTDSTTESSTEFSTDSTDTDSTTTNAQSSTTLSTTTAFSTTISPATTETPEYFFKKPIGYITAAVIAVVIVAVLGLAVGYLCWKRNMVMKAGKFVAKTV